MSDEVKKLIYELFNEQEDFRDRLLNFDVEAIHELREMNKFINNELIIKYIDDNKIQELRELAIRLDKIEKLYSNLVNEYHKYCFRKYGLK